MLRVCAACRQCEAYCPVFEAVARRDAAARERDAALLAHLCHGCGCCYDSCQYAPPHPFGVALPQALYRLGKLSRQRLLALPLLGSFGGHDPDPHGARRRAWYATAACALVCVLLVFGAALALNGPETLFTRQLGSGAFYAILPRGWLMSAFALAVSGIAALWGLGAVRFWREIGADPRRLRSIPSHYRAVKSFLCPVGTPSGKKSGFPCPETGFAGRRRFFRRLAGYGVLLALLAGALGFIEENFRGRFAPFPPLSGPVILAVLGSLLIVAGCVALLLLRSPRPEDRGERGGGPFTALLLAVSCSGLALQIFYESHVMGTLLCIHLGLLLALFCRLPFAEGAHGFFRYLAVLRDIQETR